MIGYMKPIKGTFSREDRAVYQAIYCGLCRCLKHDYGATGTAALNYELVNALLLIGATEPAPYQMSVQSCSHTPFIWRSMTGMDLNFFHAAAGLSVTLAALEIRDNVHDDNRWIDRRLDQVFSPKEMRMSERMRTDHSNLVRTYDHFVQLEQRAKAADPSVSFSMLVRASGAIAKECTRILLRYTGCHQSHYRTLCRIMGLWGEWIYLMDAVDDYQEDRRKGRFNPLLLLNRPDTVANRLYSIETQANRLQDQLVLHRYGSAVDSLFRTQLPMQRELLLKKHQSRRCEPCSTNSI